MNLVIDNAGGRGPRTGNGTVGYYIQAGIIIVGFLITVITLFVALVSGASLPTMLVVFATLAAYGCIILYSLRGYRETDKRYYLAAVYGVAAMLFCKSLVPQHTMLSEALITAGFGLLLVFADRIEKRHQAQILLVAALVAIVAEALTMLFAPLGVELSPMTNLLVRAMPLSSIILTASLATIYWTDISKQHA